MLQGLTFLCQCNTFSSQGFTFIYRGMTFISQGFTFFYQGNTFLSQGLTFMLQGKTFISQGKTFLFQGMTSEPSFVTNCLTNELFLQISLHFVAFSSKESNFYYADEGSITHYINATTIN